MVVFFSLPSEGAQVPSIVQTVPVEDIVVPDVTIDDKLEQYLKVSLNFTK